MIYFPQDDTGKHRKSSRPWHGPYCIISQDDPDITAKKIFFPDDPPIQVHQSRVMKCLPGFPSEFYWYGARRAKPGRPSKKLQEQLAVVNTQFKQLTGIDNDEVDVDQFGQPRSNSVSGTEKPTVELISEPDGQSLPGQHKSLSEKRIPTHPYSLRSQSQKMYKNQKLGTSLNGEGGDVMK